MSSSVRLWEVAETKMTQLDPTELACNEESCGEVGDSIKDCPSRKRGAAYSGKAVICQGEEDSASEHEGAAQVQVEHHSVLFISSPFF
jgi:hypothetical protein